MAVAKPLDAGQRRIVYGANVALTIILAAVVLAIVIWAAGRFGGRFDMSSARTNSLSSRTRQLLNGLDQDIRLTALYSTAMKEIRPHAEKHKARVADLLDLYESASKGKITATVIDPSKNDPRITELLKRLAEKPAYKDEAAPHAKALDEFPALNQAIIQRATDEEAQLNQLITADPRLGRVREIAAIARNLRTVLDLAKRTEEDIALMRAAETPQYGAAVEGMRDYLGKARGVFQEAADWMSQSGVTQPNLSESAKQFFADAHQRNAELFTQIDAQTKATADLQPVKLEEMVDELKRGQTIVVETPEEATVLTEDDVSPYRTDENAPPPEDGDYRVFAGEQAVSSAILKLTEKQRTAVVFVRYGGEPLLQPDFTQVNPMVQVPPKAPYAFVYDLLRKDNFVAEEWDVQKSPTPPAIENAARTVYVVFPPTVPPPRNPMQPAPVPSISPDQKQAVIDAVTQSGMAIFLIGWEAPAMSFMPSQAEYAFADYLRDTWGIEAQPSYLALHFVANPQKAGRFYPANRDPLLLTSDVARFTDQPIAAPLGSLPGALRAASPLSLVPADKAPAGVTREPVIQVPPTEQVWAFRDVNRVQEDFQQHEGTQRYEDDIPAPFPLALACTGPENRKAVIFGSKDFMADRVIEMSTLVAVGGSLQMAQLFPANADLFMNTLHWLTGDAGRIAVGPRNADVPRLTGLKEGPAVQFLKVFLVAIWPAAALLAGAGVWLVRRR